MLARNFTTGGWVESSPAVANGVVYVGSDDHNTYALNATTGGKLWSYTTGGQVSSPAVANGVVYVGSFDGNVYAIGNAAAATSQGTPGFEVTLALVGLIIVAYAGVALGPHWEDIRGLLRYFNIAVIAGLVVLVGYLIYRRVWVMERLGERGKH